MTATTSCNATSTWCYANGGGADNETIEEAVLSDADSCSVGTGNGCGTHNESPDTIGGHQHNGNAAAEYEFTVASKATEANRVYYFRLYAVVGDVPVQTNAGESYPSLVTHGASLAFTLNGVASSSTIEGVTLDIDTTPSTLTFGTLSPNTMIEGAHRLTIDSNGTLGYRILMMMDGDLLSSSGARIEPIESTNVSPAAWNIACADEAKSCFGYHTGDDTLFGGSTRFSAIDTYARISTTTLEEISFSSQPVAGEVTDVVFRIFIRELQDAGVYENNIRYISVPIF